ncbi:hypothetical protein AGDE_16742 [Angomonas deanei]|uniref:Uncharacterized protein n=1 Tax=Angomonas deanei TaxID=59799 RepID=A0A7G2CKX9_9TRYP|nr:hypothetical protein AGDE_16742 [Angomonas deanei]CAD2219591.1 hypothetical protein, conserved [Angomonas deanei]|eukprot:EPY16297.1 hypothetical protein AGDE_16742 [Angomonas deanei]
MKKYEAHRATGEEKKEHVSLTDAQTEDELLALFQEARRQEGVVEVEDQCPAPTPQEEELAHHHHAQLETLIRLFYEFNHVTFMKIPVLETLNLLARCGREAAAHTIEFESHLRMKREEKMNTLRELRNEEHALRVRQEALQQASEEMMEEAEIQRHEEMARELELEEQKLNALEHVEEEQAPVVDGVPEEDTNPPEEA